VQKPRLNLQAHYAPLDIFFYDRVRLSPTIIYDCLVLCPNQALTPPPIANQTNSSRLPADLNGDAFISAHGSWNRNPPVGYRVLHVFFDKNGMPIKYEPFLAYQGPGDTGAHSFTHTHAQASFAAPLARHMCSSPDIIR
jgi:glucose/arabinose dehydrogenase